jgi:NTP pyrophosphatase (non-canonical NTP hydrolase)
VPSRGEKLLEESAFVYLSTHMMTLGELTQAMHEFVGGKGWYDPDSPKEQTAKNIACSLVIEAAEVLEHFQWSGELLDKNGLSGELADVALYLLQLASVTGIDLEQAILDKLAHNTSRTWPETGSEPRAEDASKTE